MADHKHKAASASAGSKTGKTPCERPKPIYVVQGQGGRLRDALLDQLREQLLAGCDRAMCLRECDGQEAAFADVLAELRTLPFLGFRRVVEIHQADEFARDNRQSLEDYLNSPSETGVLVLLLEKPLPGNLRLAKLVNNLGGCLAVDEPETRDVPYTIARRARETFGKTLKPGVAQMLQELVGDSMTALAEELEKLCLYVGDRPDITPEDVQALVGNNRELSAFEIIDALLRQDTARAMQLMESVLQQDRDAEYTIIGLLAWHLRRLRKAQILLAQGVNERQICRQAKVWYGQAEFIQQAKQTPEKSLRLACKQLTQADLAVKTGGASVRSAVEKFILSLIAAGAKKSQISF